MTTPKKPLDVYRRLVDVAVLIRTNRGSPTERILDIRTAVGELLKDVYAERKPSRTVLIPENDHGVAEGDQDVVALLRMWKSDPDVVQFIADMLE